ncbi:MAG: hypothetical protein QM236_03895 [Bacillota bacterium]|jgi:hypothetical protein|nr:hypothetical protein [Bacillota bacterium]
MLANFNKSIEVVAGFTYGQQLGRLLAGKGITFSGLFIIAANLAILVIASALLYKRSLSEE